MLSIIMPVYNRAKVAEDSVLSLHQYLSKLGFPFEIVIVDDGSEEDCIGDDSSIFELGSVNLIRHDANQGKGSAVQTGVYHATGEIICFTDADLPYDLSAIDQAVEEFLQNKDLDVVLGSRRHKAARSMIKYGKLRSIANRLFSWVVRKLVRVRWKDTQCGIKFFRIGIAKELFKDLHTNGFAFDVEILVKAKINNLDVLEIPVHFVRQQESTVSLVPQTFKMLGDVMKIRKKFR